jgi:hypothetical protein
MRRNLRFRCILRSRPRGHFVGDVTIDSDQDNPAKEPAYRCVTISGFASREHERRPPYDAVYPGFILMEVLEMPQRRRPSVQKNSRDTTVVQFRLRAPDVSAGAAKVSQKMGQHARSVLSSIAADPGPAGFDWEELKSTDDAD